MHSFKNFLHSVLLLFDFVVAKNSYPYNEPRKPGSAIAVMVVAAYRMCFCSRYSVTSFTCKKTE